eukprot:CAMPEP_0201490714 /NCGR_PEP_ID=MMETSP0151_2-20130828/27144_1 /ASSEMBLY_ACC=CAM_ASM_000257 /TAXON_ID=200890 /ORGANISM="Paramoeba atlantica, Strain 621/1 / CCAP 1560/9" /LENGTH=284 /DNA_ID=CAMNT_0047876777 /DNA_START=96 /DNA_END=947 /DNA_ORIENTATION=-
MATNLKSGKRNLIINADDLGYCHERDRGVLSLHEKGVVLSVSLLVNGQSSVSAAKLCSERGISTGLHLNLTEGTPISPPNAVPSLVDSGGMMLGKTTFWETVNSISVADIKTETIAQLEKFRELVGSYPVRVDGHQHVHIIGRVFDVLVPLLEEYGVKIIRIPFELDPEWRGSQESRPFVQNVSRLADQILQTDRISQGNGGSPLTTTDHFFGLSSMGEELQMRRLREVDFQCVGAGEAVEWMVHPGERSVGYGDEFSQSPDREWEMNVLGGDQFRKWAEEGGW